MIRNNITYKIIFLLLFISIVITGKSQNFSQFYLNNYYINPAKAGVYKFWKADFSLKYNWVGFKKAPKTYILSTYGNITPKKMGMGAFIETDITGGPIQKTKFKASYSYHLKLSKNINLSLGLNFGVFQYSFDVSALELKDVTDVAIYSKSINKILPDLGLGAYLYQKNKFYLSVSLPQLLSSDIDYEIENTKIVTSNLARNFYVMGGYEYFINKELEVLFDAYFRYSKYTDINYNIASRLLIQNTTWFGFSYQNEEAISILTGMNFKKNLSVGYSYDIVISDLKSYLSSSHEVFLIFNINK